MRGRSSSGRARPCQGRGSEFEPRRPLQKQNTTLLGGVLFLEHSGPRLEKGNREAITTCRWHVAVPECVPAMRSIVRASLVARLLFFSNALAEGPLRFIFHPPFVAYGDISPAGGITTGSASAENSSPAITYTTLWVVFCFFRGDKARNELQRQDTKCHGFGSDMPVACRVRERRAPLDAAAAPQHRE